MRPCIQSRAYAVCAHERVHAKFSTAAWSAAFESKFRSVFGEWHSQVRPALFQPSRQILRYTLNATAADRVGSTSAYHAAFSEGAQSRAAAAELLRTGRAYAMDAASLLPPLALYAALQLSGDRSHRPVHLLDMAAAPGGKSLVLSEGLCTGGASTAVADTLNCVDVSAARVARLRMVLDTCLSPAVRARVTVSRGPGERVQPPPCGYDGVLLDAPCSGERHVLRKAAGLSAVEEESDELEALQPQRPLRAGSNGSASTAAAAAALWSPAKAAANAARQVRMLTAALRLCRPGGVVVYSTCSLNPSENQEVVSTSLRQERRAGPAATPSVVQWLRLRNLPRWEQEVGTWMPAAMSDLSDAANGGMGGAASAAGTLILPHSSGGAGPMYIAVLVKVQ